MSFAVRAASSLVLLLLIVGCTTFDEEMATVEQHVARGEAQAALDELSTYRVADFGNGTNDHLILLQLAMVEFMLDEWGQCERDLRDADSQLELIDFTSMPVADASRFLFTEDAGKYRGAPHEKLFLCLARLVASLAARDRELSATTARRLVEQADYWVQHLQEPAWESPLLWYLAGVALEDAGELDNARILYERAQRASADPIFRDNFARLARRTGEVEQLTQAGLGAVDPKIDPDRARLIVVVFNGRAPARVPVRLPISVAVIEALNQKGSAMEALGQWVQFGSFEKRSSAFNRCQVRLDFAGEVPVTRALDLEAQALTWWQQQQPLVYTAAASRFIVRLLAQKGVEEEAKKQGASDDMSSLFATIAGVAMTAADTPDTRCWTLLPKEAFVAECWLPPGEAAGTVTLSGNGEEWRQFRAPLEKGRTTVVPMVVWK